MQKYRAKAGAVVVVDVQTGEVLALANAPTFNPNNRANLTGTQLRNRAFTDTFEPGSVMKPFVAALALESGKFKATTKIDTSPGRLTIGSATIGDAHVHGILTVAEVIQKSSNVGTVKMALQFSPDEMCHLLDGLGFGSQLNLGFPGEATGRLRPAKSWRPIEQATMSYGHGISVSLIQLAHAYLAFARDGDLLPLSLTRVDTPKAAPKRIFSPTVAREVRGMLEMAAGPGGTAPQAQVPGYRVAGKTGTAYKIEGGQYVKKYVSSFVGLAPASRPRLVVAVMIDEPNGAHYGGAVAAPVFARIVEGSLRALGVAPDSPITPLQLARKQGAEAATAVRESM
jgi:cell division protein FtsI (penicillin-binding protein 3)